MRGELRSPVIIGDPSADHLTIRVLGRLHPGSDDFWDGNWLATPIDVSVGGFHGTVGASLRADELRDFKEAIERVQASLQSEATLESMEGWLTLQVTAESSGRFAIHGTIVDRLGAGNCLTFKIRDLDKSHLRPIVESLAEMESSFPVLGSP